MATQRMGHASVTSTQLNFTSCQLERCCVVIYVSSPHCTPVPVWDLSTWSHPGGWSHPVSKLLCNSVVTDWLIKGAHSSVSQLDVDAHPESTELRSLRGGGIPVGLFTPASCPNAALLPQHHWQLLGSWVLFIALASGVVMLVVVACCVTWKPLSLPLWRPAFPTPKQASNHKSQSVHQHQNYQHQNYLNLDENELATHKGIALSLPSAMAQEPPHLGSHEHAPKTQMIPP